jgi:hypothetical protein
MPGASVRAVRTARSSATAANTRSPTITATLPELPDVSRARMFKSRSGKRFLVGR